MTAPQILLTSTTSNLFLTFRPHCGGIEYDTLRVQAEDPAVRVRYNAAKMEQHQFRQLCTNLYDGDNEPASYGTSSTMSHATFLSLIRPAFRKDATRADVLAIIKRAWTVVFGQHQVYIRAPMPTEVDVAVVPYPSSRPMQEAMLNPSGVEKLHRCKTMADKSKPSDFDEGLEWSMALLELCIAGKGVEAVPAFLPDGGRPSIDDLRALKSGRRNATDTNDSQHTPRKKARMTVGGSSTCPVPVSTSPEVVLHVDTDDEFDLFLLGSQGFMDVKKESVKVEMNFDHDSVIAEPQVVCVADKDLHVVISTEDRQLMDETMNQAGAIIPTTVQFLKKNI
eukprot:4772175-Amphidinium_carterae.1